MSVSWGEIAKHSAEDACWIVLHDHVWDMTGFLDEHPGGKNIIMKYAGRNGTKAFQTIHPKDMTNALPKEAYIGEVDLASEMTTEQTKKPEAEEGPKLAPGEKPDIEACLNIWDLEAVAMSQTPKEAWDYLNSGGDDEITFRENHASFSRVWMRPRVLVDVHEIDTSCTMLGTPCKMPIYITATALGRLYHEDGEICLTRAAHQKGIVHMCPTLASCSMDEMVGAKSPGQTQWWQLYVNKDRNVTLDVIQKAERSGMQGLFITVDAPQLGRRERDMRNKTQQKAKVQDRQKDDVKGNEGVARAISSFIDPSLNWGDLPWFKKSTKMPIILKGVQCAEDALLAVEAGVDGIVCSNHGGRQIDTCRGGIEILAEVMTALKKRGVSKETFHVFVDGGIRRGTDIFKCVALGAVGCGMGRPFLYSIAAYGQEGAEKVVDLLTAELEMCMRLMGTANLKDIRPEHLILTDLSNHATHPVNSLAEANLREMLPILHARL